MASNNHDFYTKDYTKKWKGLSLALARKVGDEIGVDWEEVDLGEFLQGIKEEMEHGKEMQVTQVHEDDYVLSGKIALAHLKEVPDYYTRLEELEEAGGAKYQNDEAKRAWVKGNRAKYQAEWDAAEVESKGIKDIPVPCRVCVENGSMCDGCKKSNDTSEY